MKPVQLFCWHFMAYPYLDKDFDEKAILGLGHGPQQLVGQPKSARPLSGIHRPARLCRRVGFRRHGAERASSKYLRLDAFAKPDRLGTHAKNNTGKDRHPRQSPSTAFESHARGRGICDARSDEQRAFDRRLRPWRRPGDFQLRRAVRKHPGKILGGRGFDRALLDRRRSVRPRRPLLSTPLRESLAQAVAATVSAGLDSRLAQPVDHGRGRQARLLLFSLFAQSWRRNPPRATGIRRGVGKTRGSSIIRSASAF